MNKLQATSEFYMAKILVSLNYMKRPKVNQKACKKTNKTRVYIELPLKPPFHAKH